LCDYLTWNGTSNQGNDSIDFVGFDTSISYRNIAFKKVISTSERTYSLLLGTPEFSAASVSSFRAGLSDFPAVVPPSTGMINPVIQPDSLLQRNRIARSTNQRGKVFRYCIELTIADVPSSTLLSHEILADASLAHLFIDPSPADHWGEHHSRCDTINPDTLFAVMSSHGSCHLDYRAFRGRI
jgi:hypothetical protein